MGKQTQPIRDAEADPRATVTASLGIHAVLAVLPLLVCACTAFGQDIITTLVGPGLYGPANGDSLQLPTGVAVSGSGTGAIIYTADTNNCVVWKTQNGQTSIYAGELGTCIDSLGSTPTSTTFAYPVSLAFYNDGNSLFIATYGINLGLPCGGTDQQPCPPKPTPPAKLLPAEGNVFEVSSGGAISLLPSIGGVPGAGPLYPVALACDSSGNVYVSSYYNEASDSGLFSQIQELPSSSSTWTTLVSNALDQAYPALAVDPNSGDLFAIQAAQAGEEWLGTPLLNAGSIQNITRNTAGVSANNVFFNVGGLAVESNGNFLISQATGPGDYTSYVDEVTPEGDTTVLAGTGTPGYSGDGGLATSAEVNGVDGITIDSSGNVFFADSENQRVRFLHGIVPGPTTLQRVNASVPQNSGVQFGSLQGVLNPLTGDFFYVSGANNVNVINTGSNYLVQGYERIFASIPVGAAGQSGSPSPLTLAIDPGLNLIYVSNTADGNLYVIDGSTWTLVGSLPLDNAGASLLAVDTASHEVYAAGPTTTTVSAIHGGTSPAMITPTLTGLAEPVSSISVDPGTHVVYAVGEGGNVNSGYVEDLFTLTPDSITGVLSESTVPLPENEAIFLPDFIPNSIAVDPQTGSLLTAGMSSIDPLFALSFDLEDLFQLPQSGYAYLQYNWAPITVSLDALNRVFYVTDFDGSLSGPSSNAAMVTGLDNVSPDNETLTSVPIPVFPSGVNSQLMFDAEPDTSSYQAWISGSDSSDGGFVKIWDSTTRTVPLSASVPNNGGGHLMVDSTNHAAYLLDHVNGLLWLFNKPQWTPTPTPTFTQSSVGQPVTINFSNTGDLIFYTTDGSPPGMGSPTNRICTTSPCTVNLVLGAYTVIDAVEFDGSTNLASNVVQGVFAAPVTPSLAISNITPNPATTGANITATATLTTTASTVTGTVTFTAVFNNNSSTLCSNVQGTLNDGAWQFPCTFTGDIAGQYTISASFGGDSLNQPENSPAVDLEVNQGTMPLVAKVSGKTNPVAIHSNSTPGLLYSAILNTDSSLSLVQNGAVLSGEGCPAFSSLETNGVSSGAVFLDAANNRIYLAMISGSALYAAYESLDQQGNCTQGPLLRITSTAQSNVEMNVDVAQGNIYILNSFGVNFDSLYIVPAAPWNPSLLPAPAQVTLDYSVAYGPIVIDPSNHQVYIDDLGGSADENAGTYGTSGLFVYDPTHSATPASNLVWVVGYLTSGSTTATPLYVSTLLDNGSGTLVLVMENTSYTKTNDAVPLILLDTTKFSFFQNTQSASNNNSTVDITPGTGLSTIAATAQYAAIGSADINTAAGLVYAYAYSATATQAGMLLEFNLNPSASWPPGQTTAETVLSSSVAQPVAYDYNGPWTQLNYDSESTQIALWAGEGTNGTQTAALGVISPLCSGSPSLTQLVGAQGSSTPFGPPVVNLATGYIYAILPGSGYPPANTLEFVAPPPNTCSESSFPAAIVPVSGGSQSTAIGQSFGNPLVVEVTDASGNPVSNTTVTFAAPSSGASAILSSTTAVTGSNGEASVTAKANGIAGSTAYSVSATVSGVSTPATFALTNTQAATRLTVTPSANPLVYGQPVTVTAAISPSNAGGSTPSGSVTFYDGATALTPNSTVSGASASYKVSVPTVGSHTYAAQYLGNTNFAESALTDASAAVVVGEANVTLKGPATEPVRLETGQSGSIEISIAGQFAGNGIAPPSGGLNYSVTGKAFGPGSLLVANGTASIPVPGTLAAGIYTVTVSYPGDGNYNANSIRIELIIYKPWTIGPSALPKGTVGAAYSQTLTATGGSGTGYTWTVASGTALSAVGLKLSPGGAISGTPSKAETLAALTVKVTDSEGNTATRSYNLTILSTIRIETAKLLDGIVGGRYSVTLAASGGSGTGYVWSVSSGTALSSVGLRLSRSGAISGTPTKEETSAEVTVKVTDSLGNVATAKYDLTILPALTIDPASLAPATLKKKYLETLGAHGGSGTGYKWSLVSGNLAHYGLAFTATGTISGTPSLAGAVSLVVEVKDSLGDNALKTYRLTISAGAAVNDSVFESVAVIDVATVPLIDVFDNESVAANDIVTVPLNNVSDNESVSVNDVATVSRNDGNDAETISVQDINVITVSASAGGAKKLPATGTGTKGSTGPSGRVTLLGRESMAARASS